MRKQLIYNGEDKFKKRVTELLNDMTDIDREVAELEATVKELVEVIYGINPIIDEEGNFFIDDRGNQIIASSGTGNYESRIEALERAVFGHGE